VNNQVGGVYLSTNNGESWTATGLMGFGITALGVNGPNLFAATSGNGVYRSTNDGADWTLLTNGPKSAVAFASIGTIVFAAKDQGVFRSSDSGTTWTAAGWGFIDPGYAYASSLISVGTYLLAGTQGVYENYVSPYSGRILLSSDSGASWKTVDGGLPSGGGSAYTIGGLASIGSELFVGIEDTTGDGGVFHSTNFAISWTPITKGTAHPSIRCFAVIDSALFSGTEGEGVLAFVHSDSMWKQVGIGLSGHDVTTLAVKGNKLFAGCSDDGVYLSSDSGASWGTSSLNTGLPNTIVTSFLTKAPSEFATTSSDGVFLSSDSGASWSSVNSGLSNLHVQAIAASGTNLVVGTSSMSVASNIFLSSDNGSTWTSDNPIFFNEGVNTFAKIGTHLYAGTWGGYQGNFGGGVLLSTDDGQNWTAINNGLSWTDLDVNALQSIGSDLYAMTVGGIFRLADNGHPQNASWKSVNTGFVNVTTMIELGSRLIAGCSNGLYLSTDSGTSWARIAFQDTAVRSFVQNGATLFVGTSTGVFGSKDGGSNWIPFSDGFSNAALQVTALSVIGPDLIAGTNGSSVWRRSISELSVSTIPDPAFSGFRSYPNPLSSRTTLTFAVEKSGPSEVSILNLLGQPVALLFSGELARGEHSFTWDAAKVPPGMYIALARTNGREEHLPLMLVR
jgi:photosystem II stability/assembly factor-like uncharacterized protein